MRAGLVLAGALAFAAIAGCGGGAGEVAILPPGRAIETARSLDPTTHLFADPVTARLEVVVDRELLDPDRVGLRAHFEPYERVGSVKVARRDLGRYTRLRYEYTLRCLTAACIPVRFESILGEQEQGRPERRTFRLAPAQVRYEDPTGDFPDVLRSVSWPPLTAVSRLNEAQSEAEFPFRANPASLPALSYRAAPPLVAGALLLAAIALLALPARRGLRWWRDRQAPAVEAAQVVLAPLERALLLVEWARERDGAERRGALEVLAAELDRSGVREQAAQARVLAWSRTTPSSEAAEILVRRVRGDDDAAA
jgi:hypothetical protein